MPRDELMKLALDALRAHKLRSFLTLLGIIIGVASLIAVVSVVQGLNTYVSSRVMDFGSTSFQVGKFSSGFHSFDDFLKENKRKDLTYEDFKAVQDECAHCLLVAGVYNDQATVKYKNHVADAVNIRGVTVNAPYIGTAMELSEGRHFTSTDIDHARMETILGGDVAERLFPHEDPLGKDVTIGGEVFTVIGVAVKQGSFLGSPQDTFARIPITVYQKMFNTSGQSIVIQAQAATPEGMQLAIEETRVIMRNRLHRMYHDEDGFALETAETFLQIWSQTTGSIFLVMIAVVSISLVVGGIVIMNIMLVSVTERTREIGVRRALGARQADIMGQFLAEAATLSAMGGVIGILIGVGIAYIVAWLSPLPAAIKLWSVMLAFVAAAAIGIFFGIYPARNAARLDPVVALRAET